MRLRRTASIPALLLAGAAAACATPPVTAPAVVPAPAPIAAPSGTPDRGVALPDTGLFAPVAAQFRAREDRLALVADAAVTPERLRLLLAAGRPDEAASLAPRATGDPRDVAVARGRIAIVRQDFAALAPIVDGFPEGAVATAAERLLRYEWLFVRDDAARVDALTGAAADWPRARARLARALPELLAAGRLAYDMLDYPRAEALFTRALAHLPAPAGATDGPDRPDASAFDPTGAAPGSVMRSTALTGLALVQQKRRDWDASLVTLQDALAAAATPAALLALTETLIRVGRTDEAIAAGEWGVRLNPYHEGSHYLLGNGYTRRNYTQLLAARPEAFADDAGRKALAAADARLAAGDRSGARAAYARIAAEHPAWVDARLRLASLDFEEGRFAEARDGCFAALRAVPDYGRAHALLARTLEAQRFAVDVHRADYEARFAAAPMPEVPGIEAFVVNWTSLSPRHRKRVALSLAPWRAYIPVLVEGGATYFIKPMYMRLSESPNIETLRDQRIDYDSRLWDDVRGCGGYHTVTGIEDVERSIFAQYNTVLHELSHQVHAVLPADDNRAIQEHYRRAKERDAVTREAFLSRYAGGSVHEYFAEGANGLDSPRRDAYDPREVVRERLDQRDPDLRRLVEGLMARADVGASYPVALAAGGDDRVSRGRVEEALPFYRKALDRSPADETALVALANALAVGNRAAEAEAAAARAVAVHPASGPARIALAGAAWQAGRGLDQAIAGLSAALDAVRPEDRHLVHNAIGRLTWMVGDADRSLAAFDAVLAYQADNPQGLRGRAAALALAGRADGAVALFEKAVRERTGEAGLRCEYAHALLAMGRVEAARAQLDAARLLDERNPTAEALRGWAALASGRPEDARAHARQALAWGPWSDLARIVAGGAEARAGRAAGAGAEWAPVRERMARNAPPEYVYRPEIAVWEQVHALPATERRLLASFESGGAGAASDNARPSP